MIQIQKSIGLKVKCQDGKVTDVNKNELLLDGRRYAEYKRSTDRPNLQNISVNIQANHRKKKKSDPYDVYDYDDPEDFYYDKLSMIFECYEDAEDYFDDHNY